MSLTLFYIHTYYFYSKFKFSSLKHSASISCMTPCIWRKNYFTQHPKSFLSWPQIYLQNLSFTLQSLNWAFFSLIYNRFPKPFTCVHTLLLGMPHQFISSCQKLTHYPRPIYKLPPCGIPWTNEAHGICIASLIRIFKHKAANQNSMRVQDITIHNTLQSKVVELEAIMHGLQLWHIYLH